MDKREWANAMIIRYTVQQEDLMAFWLYHYRQSPLMRQQRRVATLVITGVVVAAMLIMHEFHRDWNWPDPGFLGLVAIVGTILAVLYPRRLRSRYLRTCRRLYNEGRNVGIGSPVTLEIGPEGVQEASAAGMGRFRWEVVERVATTNEHTFLYIGAMQALIVPTRAFADSSQWTEFLQRIDEYRAPGVDAGWPAGPPSEPKCPQCGYGLYYAKDQRCPECGRRFEPGETDLRLAEWDGTTLRPRRQDLRSRSGDGVA